MPPGQSHLFTLLLSRRRYASSSSSSWKAPRVRCINKIHQKYKAQVAEQARKALAHHLHAAMSVPFVFADLIAANSPESLASLLRRVRYSGPTFPAALRTLLAFHPPHLFDLFFLESIGLSSADAAGAGAPSFHAARALYDFGFPWPRLGALFAEQTELLSSPAADLSARLGFVRDRLGLAAVGACLALPRLLVPGDGDDSVSEGVFADLRTVFDCFEGDAEAWCEVCLKIRVFYELGCEAGTVGERFLRGRAVFLGFPSEGLARRAEFFCRFGAEPPEDVGSMILRCPEMLSFDDESTAISVPGVLGHLGLSPDEARAVAEKYPHVSGRNIMANLPNVTRAVDLHRWCFDRIKSTRGRVLAGYAADLADDDRGGEFCEALERGGFKKSAHVAGKLDFLRGIGFGENAATVKVLAYLQGNGRLLRERFDCLVGLGVGHSKACSMVRLAPRILGQSSELLRRKVEFLLGELGESLDYLDGFPHFLYFDLEARIKRRHRFYVWLVEEKGLGLRSRYSVASVVSASEKKFVGQIFKVHPAAPKHYLECF